MSNKQTSEPEITEREFWEWCGCRFEATKLNGYPAWSIYFPDGRCETNYLGEESNSLTLDNLFKYAVPKLDTPLLLSIYNGETEAILSAVFPDENDLFSEPFSVTDKDPAQALYKAICKVIQNGK